MGQIVPAWSAGLHGPARDLVRPPWSTHCYNPRVTDEPSSNSYSGFLQDHPNAHLLQTPEWGRFKGLFGWDFETVVSGDCGALLLYRTLPLGARIGYVAKGPVGNWFPSLLPILDQRCRDRQAFALMIEPDGDWSDELSGSMTEAGFAHSPHPIQPPRTLLIDLSDPLEDILARMHQKTRYNIRLSARKDVKVRKWVDIDAFGEMMLATGERQEFGVHTPAYYKRAYELFHPIGMAECFVAEFKGEPLAALMAFTRGERAWYLYGASTPKERSRMPTYALQWRAIEWAKSRGCRQYDLWGIPNHDDAFLEEHFAQRSDGLWGVYRFKRGFGGGNHRSAGAWDRVYRPVQYSLYRLAARWLL